MKLLLALLAIACLMLAGCSQAPAKEHPVETAMADDTQSANEPAQPTLQNHTEGPEKPNDSHQELKLEKTQAFLSQDDLLALAGNKYADGIVPLGDGKYTLTGPKKGYIYYCNEPRQGGGAAVNGPWIGSGSWNFLQKVSIPSTVSWPRAMFSISTSGMMRALAGNGLPSHKTGTFPIPKNEEGYKYDRNPNSISETKISVSLPEKPTYSDTPFCLPTGEVGTMLSGVALFDGMDAEQRDAPAHEVQDECAGHPQEHGQYHYHSLSPCFRNESVRTVLGYANDGFPITGPIVAEGKYLTTEDLDECHGITSEITDENGETYVTYHYVMTYDFPYSAGCFRAKPAVTGPTSAGAKQPTQGQQPPQGQGPPPEAITACKSKSEGSSCSFSAPHGTVSGKCRNIQGQLACAP